MGDYNTVTGFKSPYPLPVKIPRSNTGGVLTVITTGGYRRLSLYRTIILMNAWQISAKCLPDVKKSLF